MSDSVKKYYEMLEESGVNKPSFQKINTQIVSEGHKKQAYQILVEFPEEAILEAARILKVGK